MKLTLSPDVVAANPYLKEAPYNQARTKYRNTVVMMDGHRFASQKEANDYKLLRYREVMGEITNLRLQPEFVLQEAFTDRNGKRQRAIIYRADFMWDDVDTGETHVLDTKGYETQVYRLKAKLFLQMYPQYVYEVR
jgi:uncharacterized protein DUF1064